MSVGRPRPEALDSWHRVVQTHDPVLLRSLLAEQVVFRSPAVHTPQEGIDQAYAYLAAALRVLGPTLTYQREWIAADSAVLEFTADLDGLLAHGVDILRWNERGQIVEFTVLVRPLKALNRLVERMGQQLQAVKGS